MGRFVGHDGAPLLIWSSWVRAKVTLYRISVTQLDYSSNRVVTGVGHRRTWGLSIMLNDTRHAITNPG